MKKDKKTQNPSGKKLLSLDRTTIRPLQEDELKRAGGGLPGDGPTQTWPRTIFTI